MQERDARRAVGIVLDGGHLRGHADLVAAEVDEAEAPLVTAAAEAAGDAAVVVASAGRVLVFEQASLGLGLGDLDEVGDRIEAARGARGFEGLDAHRLAL